MLGTTNTGRCTDVRTSSRLQPLSFYLHVKKWFKFSTCFVYSYAGPTQARVSSVWFHTMRTMGRWFSNFVDRKRNIVPSRGIIADKNHVMPLLHGITWMFRFCGVVRSCTSDIRCIRPHHLSVMSNFYIWPSGTMEAFYFLTFVEYDQ